MWFLHLAASHCDTFGFFRVIGSTALYDVYRLYKGIFKKHHRGLDHHRCRHFFYGRYSAYLSTHFGEYIGMLHLETKKRPLYIISERYD